MKNIAINTESSTTNAAPAVADWGAALSLVMSTEMSFCVSLLEEGQTTQTDYKTLATNEIDAKLKALIKYPKAKVLFAHVY